MIHHYQLRANSGGRNLSKTKQKSPWCQKTPDRPESIEYSYFEHTGTKSEKIIKVINQKMKNSKIDLNSLSSMMKLVILFEKDSI